MRPQEVHLNSAKGRPLPDDRERLDSPRLDSGNSGLLHDLASPVKNFLCGAHDRLFGRDQLCSRKAFDLFLVLVKPNADQAPPFVTTVDGHRRSPGIELHRVPDFPASLLLHRTRIERFTIRCDGELFGTLHAF